MRLLILTFLFYFYIQSGECLWRRGIVHYTINDKDYDHHSEEILKATLKKLQRELCVKFFNTPMNYSTNDDDKILLITNPDQQTDCPEEAYDFNEAVVKMTIGYMCLNEKDIVRKMVEMLRASVEVQGPASTFHMLKESKKPSGLLTAEDKNYINSKYHDECEALVERPMPLSRRFQDIELSEQNEKFYKDKLWPLGIVLWTADYSTLNSYFVQELQRAMAVIESSSCVVFHFIDPNESQTLEPRNYLSLSLMVGASMPKLGFMEGKQNLNLRDMMDGTPGHTAQNLNLLLRILGIPMMSNRYDRDNYVTIHWKNIQHGRECLLERLPEAAMLRNSDGDIIPYDYYSATHAPANYLCEDCSLGQQTVTPVQEYLWQKTMAMGHRTNLSATDIEVITSLYRNECALRLSGK